MGFNSGFKGLTFSNISRAKNWRQQWLVASMEDTTNISRFEPEILRKLLTSKTLA